MIFAWPPSPASGRWFAPSFLHQIDSANTGPGDGKVLYYPFRTSRNLTIDRIAIFQGVVGASAGGRLHIGIYDDANGVPDALIADSGRLTLSASTELEAAITASLVATTVYWIAIAWHRDGTATGDISSSGTDSSVGYSYHNVPVAATSTFYQTANFLAGHITADIGTAFTALPATADLTSVADVVGACPVAVALRIKAGGSGFGPFHTAGIPLVWTTGTDKAITPGAWNNQAKINTFDFDDGDLLYIPFALPYSVTLKTLGIEVATAKAASNVNVAIYADDGTGQPGNKLIETADIDVSTTGDKEVNVTDTALQGRKNYWIALIYNGAAGMRLRGLDRPSASASLDSLAGLGGVDAAEVLDPNGTMVSVCLKITGETGTTLPDPAKLTGIAYSQDDVPMARFTYVTQ